MDAHFKHFAPCDVNYQAKVMLCLMVGHESFGYVGSPTEIHFCAVWWTYCVYPCCAPYMFVSFIGCRHICLLALVQHALNLSHETEMNDAN